MLVKKIITVAAIVSGLALAACNTVEGAGKDVSSVGDTVSDVAK